MENLPNEILNIILTMCDDDAKVNISLTSTRLHDVVTGHLDDFTLFSNAARYGSLDVLRYMVQCGYHPSISTLNHMFIEAGSLEYLKYVHDCLAYDHMVRISTTTFKEAIIKAIQRDRLECLKYLIKNIKDISIKKMFTESMVHGAIKCFSHLIQFVKDPVSLINDNLEVMVQKNNIDIIKHIDTIYNLPMNRVSLFAARYGRLDCLRYSLPLYKLHAGFSHKSVELWMEARSNGHKTTLKYLKQNGCRSVVTHRLKPRSLFRV